MEYFILKPNGEQTGTYSMEQVQAMLRTGFIGSDTRYWHEGIATWEPVDQIEKSLKFSEPPPAPDSTTAPVRKLPAYSRIVAPPGWKPLKPTTAAAPPSAPGALPPREDKPPAQPSVPTTHGNGHLPLNPAAPNAREPLETASIPSFAPPPEKSPPVWVGSAVRIGRFFLYALPVFALAVGVVIAVLNLPHTDPRPLFRRITLNGSDNYALIQQDAIRTFSGDLRTSPALESLTREINDTTNPSVLDRLNLGVEKERIRHADEVRQQYIEDTKAKLVEPGTYRIMGDFDDNGFLILPRDGEHWEAILYRGAIVFVHGVPDPEPTR